MITFITMGKKRREVAHSENLTVGQLLAREGVELGDNTVSVEGEQVGLDHVLKDATTVILAPKVENG